MVNAEGADWMEFDRSLRVPLFFARDNLDNKPSPLSMYAAKGDRSREAAKSQWPNPEPADTPSSRLRAQFH
jgi:hypothetical protein